MVLVAQEPVMPLLQRELTDAERGWVIGFLEGEGSFFAHGRIIQFEVTAAQVQRWPLDQLAELIGGKIYLQPARGRRQPCHWWRFAGHRAVERMRGLAPYFSPRRQMQIATALSAWDARLQDPAKKSETMRRVAKLRVYPGRGRDSRQMSI
jgi:hypothetical protein